MSKRHVRSRTLSVYGVTGPESEGLCLIVGSPERYGSCLGWLHLSWLFTKSYLLFTKSFVLLY